MERLTEKGNYSDYVRKLNVTANQVEEKLGRYEDLGFSPEDIERMKTFNSRAIELLNACTQLFNKQVESPYVLNMLDELIYYDKCECDGHCLFDDIEYLLEYGE